MKFYFAGHTTFGNRGCEALVRSTVGLIREQLPDATFVVPSSNITLDHRQWPQSSSLGVELVPAPTFPSALRWWSLVARLFNPVERLRPPGYLLPPDVRQTIQSCDAMIMSGGDVISLDYGLPSLYYWTGHVDNATRLGIPTLLWGASVGPFTTKPAVQQFMIEHLQQYKAISVRESSTHDYLNGLGLSSALVADPAFTLEPEPFDCDALLPSGSDGVLGLNVSPLIRGYRKTEEERKALDADVVDFVNDVIQRTDLGVLLIPHVGPLDGGTENNDHHYMQGLLTKMSPTRGRIQLAPSTLNAAQLKYLVSRCRYFIGARTHATIAAFSTGVPTTSIAYSVKAKGINHDLFGHLDYVLETPQVTASTLQKHLDLLRTRETEIRDFLIGQIIHVRTNSKLAAQHALASLR